MVYDSALKGVLFTKGKEHYTDNFYSGEFQNILYALSLGLYDAAGIEKLVYRFRGPEFNRCYADLVRLGYVEANARDKVLNNIQEKCGRSNTPVYKRDKSVMTMYAHMAHNRKPRNNIRKGPPI